ncbi:unnamed protein product [Caenorhabditis brenneri]
MEVRKLMVFCVIVAISVSASTPPPLTPPPNSIFFDLSIENPEMTRDITYFISAVANGEYSLRFEVFPMNNMVLKIYICENILLTTTISNHVVDVTLGALWVEHIIQMAQKHCSDGKHLMTAVAHSRIDQSVTVILSRQPSFQKAVPDNNTTKIEIPLGIMITDKLFPVEPTSLAKNGSLTSVLYAVEIDGMLSKAIWGIGFIKIVTDTTTPVTIAWAKCGLLSSVMTQVDINEEVILKGEILNVLNMFKDTYCKDDFLHTNFELILTTHSSSTGTVTISFEKFDYKMYVYIIFFMAFVLSFTLMVMKILRRH